MCTICDDGIWRETRNRARHEQTNKHQLAVARVKRDTALSDSATRKRYETNDKSAPDDDIFESGPLSQALRELRNNALIDRDYQRNAYNDIVAHEFNERAQGNNAGFEDAFDSPIISDPVDVTNPFNLALYSESEQDSKEENQEIDDIVYMSEESEDDNPFAENTEEALGSEDESENEAQPEDVAYDRELGKLECFACISPLLTLHTTRFEYPKCNED